MKTTWRKLTILSTLLLIRNFFLSLLFMAILVGTLYILITSPA